MARREDLRKVYAAALEIFVERHKKYGTKTPRNRKTALDMCQMKIDRMWNFTMPEDRDALLASLGGQMVIDLVGLAELSSHPGIAYEGLCW